MDENALANALKIGHLAPRLSARDRASQTQCILNLKILYFLHTLEVYCFKKEWLSSPLKMLLLPSLVAQCHFVLIRKCINLGKHKPHNEACQNNV